MDETRVGLGIDFHRLVEDRLLVLGGVEVPHDRGLLGHSDADVLTHAICDALLGAAGLPDIGVQFPDSDEAYRGASSLKLLSDVVGKIAKAGYRVGNVDATLIAEAPKLAPWIPAMQENLATRLGIETEKVGVKATTSERMGPMGRGEGIAAWAVCLIRRI